jgi:hypothetical protein
LLKEIDCKAYLVDICAADDVRPESFVHDLIFMVPPELLKASFGGKLFQKIVLLKSHDFAKNL